MTTQIIGAQAAGVSGKNLVTGSRRSADSGRRFEDIIGNSLDGSNGNSNTAKSKTASSRKTAADAAVDKADVLKNGQPAGKAEAKKAADDKDAYVSVDNSTVSGPDMPDEEMVSSMEEQIGDAVKAVMDLSDEELSRLLEMLGLTMIDLLNPENLKKLVLAEGGESDLTALLTNEDMTETLAYLNKEMEGLGFTEEFQMTGEELADFIKEALTKHNVSAAGSDNIPAEHKAGANQEEVLQAAANHFGEESIPVAVEKEGFSENGQESGSSMKGQDSKAGTQEPQSVSMEQFVHNMTEARLNGNGVQTEQAVPVMREIVNQVVEQIKVVIKPDVSSMELQLNPDSLGRVNLSVTAKNGQMTASFVVQNEVAKEALESQMQVLRDNLETQGLKVDAVEVTVSNFGFEQSQNQQQQDGDKKKSQRRINLDEYTIENGDLTEEESLAADIMIQNGNSVDYTI